MKKTLSYLEIILGLVLTAAAFGFITVPQSFSAGGVTGLSILVHRIVPISLSLILLFFNIIIFILGWIFVGKEFIFKTLMSSFLFPFILDFFSHFNYLQELQKDPLLSAILAGLLLGCGSGLVLRGNGSSGGFDVIGVILHKYFHTPVSLPMYILDTTVILLQGNDLMHLLYGLTVIFLCSYIINKVLSFGKAHSKIMIFSHQSRKIRKMLLTEFDTGLTILKGESGYYEEDMDIIVTITSYDKISNIKKAVYTIDPFAFVVIEDVHAVLGKGYTISREKDPS
jgi:uncharacterized membrane-anchored protein YitT (DUF2179 family)